MDKPAGRTTKQGRCDGRCSRVERRIRQKKKKARGHDKSRYNPRSVSEKTWDDVGGSRRYQSTGGGFYGRRW